MGLPIIQYPEDQHGLSLVPDVDADLKRAQKTVNSKYACKSSGNVVEQDQEPSTACAICEFQKWEKAVVSEKPV